MFPMIILAIENEGDREFMMWLYTQFHALLYSEIRKIVRNDWDTEDLLQNVLEKLIDKIPKLREMDRKGMINYLITAAKNTAHNFQRDTKPFKIVVSSTSEKLLPAYKSRKQLAGRSWLRKNYLSMLFL